MPFHYTPTLPNVCGWALTFNGSDPIIGLDVNHCVSRDTDHSQDVESPLRGVFPLSEVGTFPAMLIYHIAEAADWETRTGESR